jgi:hypothetical protein
MIRALEEAFQLGSLNRRIHIVLSLGIPPLLNAQDFVIFDGVVDSLRCGGVAGAGLVGLGTAYNSTSRDLIETADYVLGRCGLRDLIDILAPPLAPTVHRPPMQSQ